MPIAFNPSRVSGKEKNENSLVGCTLVGWLSTGDSKLTDAKSKLLNKGFTYSVIVIAEVAAFDLLIMASGKSGTELFMVVILGSIKRRPNIVSPAKIRLISSSIFGVSAMTSLSLLSDTLIVV